MRTFFGRCFAVTVIVLLAVQVGVAETQGFEDMSLQDMLFMNVNVVTASKTEQSIIEAPAAVYVITAEDIKLSGATQLGEALTMVPGFNIRHGTAGSMHIGGMRGLSLPSMNKIVLLINGMPWEGASYKEPLLFVPPCSLNDIDRIEVMEGPGSSLYGADAMTGVINIILKKPKDTRGAFVSATGGSYNTYLGTLRYGGSIGSKVDYRVTGFYTQRDNYADVPFSRDPVQRIPSGQALLDYRINGNSSLSVLATEAHADRAETEYDSTGIVDFAGSNVFAAQVKYAIDRPDVVITVHQEEEDCVGGYTFGKASLAHRGLENKIEAQNTLGLFARNKLVWGAALQHNMIDAQFAGGKRYRTQTGVFFDDTYKVSDWCTINGGARSDKRNDVSDPVYSHRVSVMFFPWANHRIRFTEGTSYRNPDFVESFFYSRTDLGGGLFYEALGNPDLKPEKANSLEASYATRIKNFGFDANVFIMNVKDIISTEITSIWPFPAPTGQPIPRTIGFVNGGEAQITGTEVQVRYLFTKWLSGLANYTHIYQREVTPPVETLLKQTPEHMAGVQFTIRPSNRFTVNLSGNYVSETKWMYVSSWGGGGQADAYTIANLYVGYKILPNLEVSLAVADLFDLKYSEYPIAGMKIGRRTTGTISYQF